MSRYNRTFRNPFRRRAIDAEVDEELRFHIERTVQRLIEGGMNERQAYAEAERRFGSWDDVHAQCTRERKLAAGKAGLRDRVTRSAQALGQVARSLLRTPGSTVPAVLVLAVAIGANTAIFSIVSRVLIEPVPGADLSGIVRLDQNYPNGGTVAPSPPAYMEWREGTRAFEHIVAYSDASSIVPSGDGTERLVTLTVAGDFFQALNVDILHGPGFGPEDDRPGAQPKVVISHGLWLSRFGGDPGVAGQTLQVEDTSLGPRTLTVVGVAPPGFRFPNQADLWTPIYPHIEGAIDIRGAHYLSVLGKLGTGVSEAEAVQDLKNSSAEPEVEPVLTPFEGTLNGEIQRPLLILLAAVGIVLIIACANVGNLLLSRAILKTREIAVRTALGASRVQVFGGFVAEGLWIGGAACLLGIGLASVTLDGLVSLSPTTLPGADAIGLDRRVLVFSAAVAIAASLVAGIIPALRFSDRGLAHRIRSGSLLDTSNPKGSAARSRLVVLQLALTVVLLVGTAAMVRSLGSILAEGTGFAVENRVAFQLGALQGDVGRDPEALGDAVRRLTARFNEESWVESATVTRSLPLQGGTGMPGPLEWDGIGMDPSGERVYSEMVGAGYFETMGISLIQGRTFSEIDRSVGPEVAVVNQAFVDQFSPDEPVIGRRATTLYGARTQKEIVGVVANVKRHALTEEPVPTLYSVFERDPERFVTVIVASERPVSEVASRGFVAIQAILPEQPRPDVVPLAEYVRRAVSRPRYLSLLLSLFSGIAVLLALTGFYAVTAANAAEGRREIGIRMAMGADGSDIGRMVLGRAGRIVAWGLGIGVVVSMLSGRLIQGLLYEVSAISVQGVAVAAVALLVTGLVAAYLPARRSSRLDPVRVLVRED